MVAVAGLTIVIVMFVVDGVPKMGGEVLLFESSWIRVGTITASTVFTLWFAFASWWRVNQVRRTLDVGDERAGTITDVQEFHVVNMAVSFVFDHEGREIRGCNEIVQSHKTKALAIGQRILLIVDALRPHNALMAEVFTPQFVKKAM